MWLAPWRNQGQQWNFCIWWFPFSLQKAARCHSHSALGYPTRASHRVWTCGQQWQRYLCFWMQTQPDLITCRTLFSHGSAPHRRWLHTTCQNRVVYGWSRLLQNRCCLGGPQAIARMVRHYPRSNNHTFASIVRLFRETHSFHGCVQRQNLQSGCIQSRSADLRCLSCGSYLGLGTHY